MKPPRSERATRAGASGPGPRAIVPSKKKALDVYVSFVEQDNHALVQGQGGWVDTLHRALEIRLNQLRGVESYIWRTDRPPEAVSIVEHRLALESASVFVAVVSPRYLESVDAKVELKTFVRRMRRQPPGKGENRVFKVVKSPVPLDRQPSELQSLIGYEFYKTDETGRIREFDEIFGPAAQREFWIRLDELAHDIASLDAAP